jgi:hypothetical protein
MPYIQLEARTKFQSPVTEALNIMRDPTDSLYLRGEHFGYFVNRVVKRYLGDPDYTANSFNSAHFLDTKKKTLSNAADSIAALINKSDPLGGAGDLHYALMAVTLGFLGQAEAFRAPDAGMQAYILGILERVQATVETANMGSARDMTMMFRRHLIIRGILQTMLAGVMLVPLAPKEDSDQPTWVGGKLNVPGVEPLALAAAKE